MIDAITTTNSGKPIGRWLDETQASAFKSVTQCTSLWRKIFIGRAVRRTTHFPGWLVRRPPSTSKPDQSDRVSAAIPQKA
jgi:hypothetical protein